MCSAPIGGQGAKFGIERQAQQALAARHDADNPAQGFGLLHHLGGQVEHQRGLVTAHGTGYQLAVLLGLGADQVRQQ
ncbi:hypothetical protein D9M69_618570 [compost metagenome]